MVKPVIVIGAGICGISTAIWLQRSNFEVLLLDKANLERELLTGMQGC